jgi:3-deoxy-D-manno-octulosonic-acid transferase
LSALYSIGIYITEFAIRCLAVFNSKLKKGTDGRKTTFSKLSNAITSRDKTIWMHCASLGEYEQGLPVLQELKVAYPSHKIVVSFFSPSGYEVKKNGTLADVVVYLPLDTLANARQFLNAVHPDLVIFVKYEIWPNLLLEIKKRNITALLISATFRKNQSFFKWYGQLTKKALFAFDHIFTQDENSKILIKSIGYHNVTVSGDTRFDRVTNQLNMDNTVAFLKDFTDNKTTIVFGSSWPEDDALFIPFINNYKNSEVKFIIAPHNINKNYTARLLKQIKRNVVYFSELESKDPKEYAVFILDTIGYLSKAYSYSDIAYVGGAAGKTGLHNVLEPAVFGIPVIIGKNYDTFPEAKQLIDLGGITAVKSSTSLHNILEELILNLDKRKMQGQLNSDFVTLNKGAVNPIINYINNLTFKSSH